MITVASRLAGALLLLASAALPALAEEPAVYAPDGVALSGYDAVSYFAENGPRAGSPSHALMWHGATWYFATPQSMERFEMNPTAYAPQFGGYCAYGISEGHARAGSPLAFIIHRGKLYMLQDARHLAETQAHIDEVIDAAEDNWPAAIGH